MSMSIRTNVSSLNAQRNLNSTQNALDSSLSKLSSGYRITNAGDDAAGLGISTKLEAQIRSYAQATRNANDGISVIQSTESALNESSNILTRLRELAMQSASDGVGDSERQYINTESTQLLSELDRIASVTEYNGTKLLNASTSTGSTSLDFQVGIANTGNDRINFSTIDASTAASGLNVTGMDLSSKVSAQAALDTIDAALAKVSSNRATLGAAGNRLQSAINNISAFSESLSAANSRIKDVDVASETSNMSRLQILSQAGVSVLAQANQMPQLALKLLG
jgi:flagellin